MLMINLIDKKKDQGRLGLVFQELSEQWNILKNIERNNKANQLLSSSSSANKTGQELDTSSSTGLRQRHNPTSSAGTTGGGGGGATSSTSTSTINSIPTSSTTTSSSYATMVPNMKKEVMDFLWFDFHKECAKMKWFNLSKIFDLKGMPDIEIYIYRRLL
jgi:hypothetical protein